MLTRAGVEGVLCVSRHGVRQYVRRIGVGSQYRLYQGIGTSVFSKRYTVRQASRKRRTVSCKDIHLKLACISGPFFEKKNMKRYSIFSL